MKEEDDDEDATKNSLMHISLQPTESERVQFIN
jgi:hypothetical protein